MCSNPSNAPPTSPITSTTLSCISRSLRSLSPRIFTSASNPPSSCPNLCSVSYQTPKAPSRHLPARAKRTVHRRFAAVTSASSLRRVACSSDIWVCKLSCERRGGSRPREQEQGNRGATPAEFRGLSCVALRAETIRALRPHHQSPRPVVSAASYVCRSMNTSQKHLRYPQIKIVGQKILLIWPTCIDLSLCTDSLSNFRKLKISF